MDVATFENMTRPIEVYHRVNVSQMTFDDTELDISGVGKFNINDDLFTVLCRFVGIPKGLNAELRKVDKSLWEQVVRKLYQTHYESELVVKVQDDVLVGISNYEKDPVGNSAFINRTISHFDDLIGMVVDDIMYIPSNQHSSVLVMNTHEHVNGTSSYRSGAVIENDSLYGISVRLAIKDMTTGHIFYGTPKTFNVSSARYNRTSTDGLDAFNNMLITLSDAMRSDFFKVDIFKTLDDLIYRETTIKATYEEFYQTRTAIIRACTLSGFDEDTVKKIVEDFRDLFDFYKNYNSVMESNFIWRTTAFSDKTLSVIREFVNELAKNVSLCYEATRNLRSFSGELIFNDPLYQSVAIRK